MQALAVLEGNLVVVEPRLETMLRHANVDSCITGCLQGKPITLLFVPDGKALHSIR